MTTIILECLRNGERTAFLKGYQEGLKVLGNRDLAALTNNDVSEISIPDGFDAENLKIAGRAAALLLVICDLTLYNLSWEIIRRKKERLQKWVDCYF